MTRARHPDYWVATGPTRGTDWCHLAGVSLDLLAPGGVVLCTEGTNDPHPDAAQAAQSAWDLLAHWFNQQRGDH